LRELFVEAVRDGDSQPYARRACKVVRESGSSRMFAEMIEVQHHNLDALLASNADALPRAAELLAAAPMVHVAGFRSCFPIAFSFHYIYGLFRSSVRLIRGDAGTLEMELRALSPKDAVLVAGFAPYSQESMRVATAAREAGCTVIALTDSTVAPIALEADCTLLFAIDSPSFFPSITSGVAMVEALVEHLLKKGKGAIRALEQTEGQLHRTGPTSRRGAAETPALLERLVIRIGVGLLDLLALRQVEAEVLRRHRLQEPLGVERVDLAAAHQAVMVASTTCLNPGSSLRIMKPYASNDCGAHHHPVVIRRQRARAGQQHVVHHERGHAARLQDQERLAIVLGALDRDVGALRR
jgi:DNA-binding MurR/RpiR family transcriptional regulator